MSTETNNPDVFIVTNDDAYQRVKQGRKTIADWPSVAAEIFPELQKEVPELRDVTLQDFIKHCPIKMEFVA